MDNHDGLGMYYVEMPMCKSRIWLLSQSKFLRKSELINDLQDHSENITGGWKPDFIICRRGLGAQIFPKY